MEKIVINELSKKFMFKTALDHLSLELKKGKIIGLVGPNGCGKSTLMRILAGQLQKTSGQIHLDHGSRSAYKEKVSFMPTESHLYGWMTVKEIVDFYDVFFLNFNKEKTLAVVEDMALPLKSKISMLSTGQRGRLKVALTLYRQAELYLIDEPLNGIDPVSRDYILDMILKEKNENKCILVSSHLVVAFEGTIDEVVFMDQGRVVIHEDLKTLLEDKNMDMKAIYKEVFHV